jgi:hypothetical protein
VSLFSGVLAPNGSDDNPFGLSFDGVPSDELGRELAGLRAGGVAFGLLVVLGATPFATRAGAGSFAAAGAAGAAVRVVVPPPRVAVRRGFRGGGAVEAILITREANYNSLR